MQKPIFFFVSSLSYKTASILSAAISGLLGISLGESLTNQWGSAALAGVIASGIGAAFVAIPKLITARAAARSSDAEIRTKATAALIANMTEFQERETAFYKRVIAEKELIAMLERKSKHKAINEWTGACAHIRVIEGQLANASISPAKEYIQKSYSEIVGEEDLKIQKVAENRVDKSPLPGETKS